MEGEGEAELHLRVVTHWVVVFAHQLPPHEVGFDVVVEEVDEDLGALGAETCEQVERPGVLGGVDVARLGEDFCSHLVEPVQEVGRVLEYDAVVGDVLEELRLEGVGVILVGGRVVAHGWLIPSV